MQRMMEWAEQGRMPDLLVRAGIRRLLAERLAEVSGTAEATMERRYALIESMRAAPVALSTDIANEQHYEIPTAYFEQCLGPRLKYSSAWWPEGVDTLEAAEVAMLRLTCERAGIADGQRVLELGCGWGSLSLWMAEQYPGARITAVSNSSTQRAFIEARRDALGLANLEVLTADMNTFAPPEPGFDRAVSIEMFEHMRNWPELLRRIAGWLNPGGRFFMHVFAHREHAYVFESEGEHDWMGRYFFRDGLMPSDDLARHFQEDLRVIRQWRVGGQHYARTINAWLARQDRARDTLMPLFETAYGAQQAALWFQRWRIFYMACAELFDYGGGDEWFVSHVLFERPGD
ncbi:Cyclopropane-fatty-acyl-phospholipid synthase [Thioalkalivibrio sp. K90mix]|uniref:SAM-dependent methyltransferase n=1 Tax=Thioalkalivibrio sp. (strain K90mix) TaxID=396595 RepID=UPI000195933D|nr:cyclopropane-fatty-acyl-phospholipid synthase family protein [Thioalkalivibrio sp. K90mix]ADC72331.1 Cyclopropane-fatty-acyl-phospholipid synthase [Thioalkalivibrio sp. K90mix]